MCFNIEMNIRDSSIPNLITLAGPHGNSLIIKVMYRLSVLLIAALYRQVNERNDTIIHGWVPESDGRFTALRALPADANQEVN